MRYPCGRVAMLGMLLLLWVQTVGFGQTPPPDLADLPPPVPVAQQLTLDQALTLAQSRNPLMTATVHQIAGAKANLHGQSAPLNPILNLTGQTNTSDFFDPSDPTKYGLVTTFEISGRQRLRTHQARAQLQGTEADAESTRLSVREATASAYIDLQVKNRDLDTEKQAYDIAKRLADLTEQQVQLGDASEATALRARIELTKEENNLIKAADDVKQARATLNVQLGRAPETPIDAADPLTYTPLTLDLPMLQQQAMQFRPELRAAAASRRALEAALGLQRSQYLPDFVVGVNPLGARNGQVELGVSFPLFDLGSIRGQVRKAQEDVKAQDAQIEQVRQVIRLDVQSAYLAVKRAQRLITSFQDGILPRAESLLQRVQQSLALGASSILDVIDAQQTYRTTRNDYDAALGDYRRAIAQLERAIGAPIK
ncbi:MAG TPA: TolC family protein [Chthonomonadaceae bacterium]|nr:TolC family protein [Chthonomonadaceae bacterium]